MGTLILLTTPLGNMDDLSGRVLAAIKKGERFVVEDTRTFKALLSALGLHAQDKQVLAFHDQSRPGGLHKILEWLKDPRPVYLMSDRGSPAICDPAYPVVREALEAGHQVDTFPGPSALVTALELSGLPAQPLHFFGFIPREAEGPKQYFAENCQQKGTYVFFESPHRVLKTCAALAQAFPAAQVCLAAELTKKFQRVHRFKAQDFEQEKESITVKGEFVLLFYLSKEQEVTAPKEQESKRLAQAIVDGGARPKAVAKLVGEILQKDPKAIYRELLKSSS